MPQFDMMLITAAEAGQAERLKSEPGKAALSGAGDLTYRCGACKARLLNTVSHDQICGIVVECGKCGKLNAVPHDHHHHH
tara:strand:+ start:91 stop:330 length:240 start_codon:yes stop_codon:yes gene_type:complete